MSIYLEELVEESVQFIFIRLDGVGWGAVGVKFNCAPAQC